MSGKDERKLFDIPICLAWGGKPRYWMLSYNESSNDPSAGWLLSNKYIEDTDKYSVHVVVKAGKTDGGFFLFIKKLKIVCCYQDMDKHVFKRGNATFEKVIDAVKRYYLIEGYQQRGGIYHER